MGMLRCNLEEEEEPAMATFLGRLNHEIQDILAYKDYTNGFTLHDGTPR
jgi:hypothetical protein